MTQVNIYPYLVGTVVVLVIAVAFYRNRQSSPRQSPHPFFTRLWLLPPGEYARWEAELDTVSGGGNKIGFNAASTHAEVSANEPTESEVQFCKDQIAHLDELRAFAEPVLCEAWRSVKGDTPPPDWRAALTLDGISVPRDGNRSNPWGLTYYCEPLGHYIVIDVRDGRPNLSSIDG